MLASSTSSEFLAPADTKDTIIHVRGLDAAYTADDVRALFAPFGNVTHAEICCDFLTKVSRGEALVSFADKASATAAISAMNGAQLGSTVLDVASEEKQRSVIVIGGGLAGLSAAIEAARFGAHVLVIEKEQRPGGNSAKASSGMNAVDTEAQHKKMVEDDAKSFIEDTIKSGGGISDPKLVDRLATKSKEAWEFLTSLGIDLSVVSQCGGHSKPRTHRNAEKGGKPVNVGWEIMSTLQRIIQSPEFKSKIHIVNQARATSLVMNEIHHVSGVKAEVKLPTGKIANLTWHSDAVVVATGGYSAAGSELIKKYRPDLAKFPSTNGVWSTGDGLKLCEDIGAFLVHMDKVQVHPSGYIDPSNPAAPSKFLAPEALRAEGAVLLNAKGQRFVNELGRRDEVTAAILENCATPEGPNPAVGYLVLPQEAVKNFGEAILGFYQSKGFIRALDVAGLAATMGLPTETVQKTIDDVNSYTSGAAQDPLGRTHFGPQFESGKLLLALITPSLHYCMGGVAFNNKAQVLSAGSLTPIPGLYAAGEVTGGLHGQNRLAGNSLLECVVYGRTAGRNAVLLKPSLNALCSNNFVPLKLSEKIQLSATVQIFRFALPTPQHTVGLEVGQYIAVRAMLEDKPVVRYYSPISRPDDVGHLELCIKTDTGGIMGNHLNALQPGDFLEFQGPISGLELKVGEKTKIGMLAGGTGIAPMVQLLRSHFLYERKMGQPIFDLRLLYGCGSEDEILLRNILEAHATKHSNFKLEYTLAKPPADWPHRVGFITKEMIKETMPAPSEDVMIVVCGPPPMCAAIKPMLRELGYEEGKTFFSYL